ncbi:YciI family protein [Maricaulis maris]|uniref:Uncharacterized protein YciI n=1 Tax=Maricaulis maris TaxID=74318 RepID=A0A495DDN0_9PROT|nr:YciI family protein [Maricaulis maris]RKR00401.1 uncharacterized protein YciI [Maricaulis maris]
MYLILLKFADKAAAPAHMDGHKAWLQRGFDDGVFLASGSLTPAQGQGGGGAVLAHNAGRAAIEARIATDPFVTSGVVTSQIVEFEPSRFDDRLAFLASA